MDSKKAWVAGEDLRGVQFFFLANIYILLAQELNLEYFQKIIPQPFLMAQAVLQH